MNRLVLRPVCVLLVALVTSLVVGLPAALILLGTACLRFATGRTLGVSAAAAWAAAVVLEIGVLLAGLMALPVLGLDILTRPAAAVVLLLPVLVAAASLLRARVASEEPTPWLDPTLGGICIGVLAAAHWVQQKGPGTGVAWAMSGDARNHVLLARGVIDDGGLTLTTLRHYPATSDGVAAAVAALGGRTGRLPGALLLHDVNALAHSYVVMAVLLSGLFACAVAAAASTRDGSTLLHGPGPAVAAVVASVLPVTALVSGTALHDGFFSAYLGLVVLLAAVVLMVVAVREGSGPIVVLLASTGPLLLTVWSVLSLLVPPAVLVLLPRLVRSTRPKAAALALAAAALALIAPAVVAVNHTELAAAFVLPGGLTRPHEQLLTALVLLTAGSATLAHAPLRQRASLTLLAALTGGGVVLMALAAVGPGPARWQYYGGKTLWLVTASFLWILVMPGADLAMSRRRGKGIAAIGAAALGAVALAAADMSTPLKNPLQMAAEGWDQPVAANVPALRRFGDAGTPYIFWHWSDGSTYTGEDRIDNFWAVAAWDGAAPANGLDPVRWGYESSGDPQQLCTLASAVPGLRVVTRDPHLQADLAARCAPAAPQVVLDS